MFNAIARPSPPKHARGLAQNILSTERGGGSVAPGGWHALGVVDASDFLCEAGLVVPDRAPHATGALKQAPALAGNNFRTTRSGAFVSPRHAATLVGG